MGAHFVFVVWTLLLFFSSKSSGLKCSSKCGSVLEDCSCQATCMSLTNCCPGYNQSCFQVSPYSSSMLGGKALRILGLTLSPNDSLHCRFKGKAEPGIIDEEGHPYCISPLLYETGWISFEVSTDGIHFNRSGEYLSVRPSKEDPSFEVTLVNSTLWQNYGTPNMEGWLRMTWNSSLVESETIDVELWGYREVNRTICPSSLKAEISYLYSLGKNISNTGNFSFFPEPKEYFSVWELGNIRISASSESEGKSNVLALWSSGQVLAWHLEYSFRADSSAWAQQKCLEWDVLEKTFPNFLAELIDCPCSLAQARADIGRFHTDYSCNIETGSVCTYHPGCVHCVRAIHASPTNGSGQQCCYDSTGALVLTGDSMGGGTPDRAHDWGSPPYRDPPRVPGYSHWVYDVMSYYYCCLWSDLCHIYLHHRPSSDCRRYQPPSAGVVFGCLHFVTFDGLSYTFSGKGEYHLVLSEDRQLRVQARTEQLKLENGTFVKGTQLSSVAMKEKSSDVIEVRTADGHLQVLRNQKILSFTEQTLMNLQGVFVFAPSPQSVTVIFSCGAAVELRLQSGTMSATVLLPPELFNHTLGLLGRMNAYPSDDLMTQSGGVMSLVNATPEEIFPFGARWNISKMSSLFTYDSHYLLDSYFFPSSHDPAFVPAFSLPMKSDDPLVADMLSMCLGEGEQFCKHDTLISRSLAVGNATLKAHQHHQALMEALKPVVSCGWLPTPRNGKKNGTHYLQGKTLGFTCNEGYILYRSTERTCLEEGMWTGEQPYCITDDTVSFIVGAVGSVSALITMVIAIKLHNRKVREKKEPIEMVTQVHT